MKGLEISRAYFDEFGMPMLQEKFPELLPHVAAGLFGSGSECFGFDDEVSRDHDFDPGFMLLLPGEDVVDRKAEFALERAYAALPKEFAGVTRPMMAPVGGSRRGVMRLSGVLRDMTGSATGELSLEEWLVIPPHALAEVVNGEVFYDGSGELTAVRTRLARYPEDIRRKKLAGYLVLASQAGQYNYRRCLAHGETAAAQMAVFEFALNAMRCYFLLNDVYMPFYKWYFRAFRAMPNLEPEAILLEYLISTDNEDEIAVDKFEVIECIAEDIVCKLREQGMTKVARGDLDKHAYSVNDGIADSHIRNLHIMAGT